MDEVPPSTLPLDPLEGAPIEGCFWPKICRNLHVFVKFADFDPMPFGYLEVTWGLFEGG